MSSDRLISVEQAKDNVVDAARTLLVRLDSFKFEIGDESRERDALRAALARLEKFR